MSSSAGRKDAAAASRNRMAYTAATFSAIMARMSRERPTNASSIATTWAIST